MSHGASDTARIDGLFELAFRRHRDGQFSEAEQLYRSILEIDPRQLDCLHFLGMIALQDRRPEQAVALIKQAIDVNDRIAAYHGTIAGAYRALGEPDEAIAHCRKAVAIDPTFSAAHNLLADLLRDQGDLAAASQHYSGAAAAEPDLPEAHHNLAVTLLEQGRPDEAVDAASRVAMLQDTAESRALFVQCVTAASRLPGDQGFRQLLTRAFTEVWARPVELAGPALTLIKADPAIRSAMRAVDEIWPRRVDPNVLAPAMVPLTQDPLVYCVLESTPVADDAMERMLTCVRTLLIDAALQSKDEIAPEMLPFSCALARQCFINEYAFHVPDVEQDGAVALRGKLASELAAAKPILNIQLIAYACYAPLHTLDRNAALQSRTWPNAIRRLIDQQVREPEGEAKLRAAMPRLNAITDQTSARVRDQYESNPYPRWTMAAPVRPEPGIAAYLRGEFPLVSIADTPEAASADILIAGCGTGQQAIDAARRFPAARVLGIDLSLASLAYAQRKATEFRVENLEFAQADIVGLEFPGRRFDAIESSGVLHHLADPFAGWETLLRSLRPGGFMRLGLYSELARRDIAPAREFVTAGGYDTTPDGIRRCRQGLLKSSDPHLRAILASPDFYSISACRDLLFHVQEHRLTLPQIAAFLTEHKLSLLGFELSTPLLAQYRDRFPADTAMTDLDQWHRFETENPDTFGGMYQFWVQKAA